MLIFGDSNHNLMKKFLTLLLIATALTPVTSCKKMWKCECRAVSNWEDWNPVITFTPVGKAKKKDAEVLCSSMGYNYGDGNYRTCLIRE